MIWCIMMAAYDRKYYKPAGKQAYTKYKYVGSLHDILNCNYNVQQHDKLYFFKK